MWEHTLRAGQSYEEQFAVTLILSRNTEELKGQVNLLSYPLKKKMNRQNKILFCRNSSDSMGARKHNVLYKLYKNMLIYYTYMLAWSFW